MEDDKKVRLETLIEKFISDIQEEYQQALINKEDSFMIKTVSAMAPPSTASNDIDKKIADLGNLIKRLQSEITNISLKSQKSNESPLNLTDNKEYYGDEEEDCPNVAEYMPKDVNVTSSPFSVTSNLSEPLKEASKKFDEAISDFINVTKKMDNMAPSIDEVKNTINSILEEEKDNLIVAFKDSLEELIYELKGDISNKMDELKDVKEPCNNADDDLHDD